MAGERKQTRNSLSLSVKLQILREIEVEKKKKTDVAQKHNIPQSSLSTIIKNSEKIHQQALHAGESSRKRARGSTYADVDEALLQWFKQARSAALPVNGPLLSEKAKTLALEFGLKDFTGSGGWIERWKARHGIKLRNICGESADVNHATFGHWKGETAEMLPRNQAPSCSVRSKSEGLDDGLLFESWVRHIDKKMAGQHRQIILLLDNCGAHPPDMQGLTNTRIAFLPPNTTSMLQPCDQGIIRNFKMIYRTRLMRKYLTAYDAGTALTINLKQAVDIISVAWNDVLPATISNCWHHSGIIKSDVSSPLDTPQPATQMWEQQSLFDRMKEVLKIPLEMDFDSYADADNDVVTNAMLSDVEIVESILQAKEEEETDQVDEEVDPIVHIPHPKEVLESIQTLRLFLQCQDESKSLHRHLSDLDNIEKSVQHFATETYELIKEAFGDAALFRSRTFEWFSRFQKVLEKVNDDQHTGRPRSFRCEENKLKIKELIKSNRRISIKDLSSETGLSVYLGIMRCLREAVRLKRPERWQNNDWILHVGNARPHTAHVVLQFLAKHSTIQIPHPLYSPDLAPNDFFLYPKLKMNLKGRKFDNVDMIQA
ncbi:TIGD4 [Cordylochernes scorpioides]|uniref:TIGD4 n=1 Tax=Cordylochernes scorpioides TaxID=51811 RepID=A0ABY6LTI5_9ARAC|nr:TIGD4 [Cordylochernes scorpioides]